MKSKKRKINIDGFKQKLMDWFLSDEGKEMVEEYKKLPEEEKQRLKRQRKKYIVGTIILLLISSVLIYNINSNFKENNTLPQNIATVTKTKKEPKTITSGELTKYMIDDLNNIYVKIANTKLGDNVAYSITYNYDIIPQGELSYTKYFVSGELTSVFMNGYPNLSYEEMDLQNEEEAYIATQLAVYEIISRKQLTDISNGTFSLDMIRASEEQYEEMVDRMLNKAKELANYAMENPYNSNATSSVELDKVEFEHINDDTTIAGPIYIYPTSDEYMKRVYGEELEETSDLSLKSYFEQNKCSIVDENMNEISKVEANQPFYVKIDGPRNYFVQVTISTNLKRPFTKIYSSDNSKKQYIILDSRDLVIKSIKSIASENVEFSQAYIKFFNTKQEDIENVSYRIYGENGQMLQDVDGFSNNNTPICLPIGKYYIQQYDAPDGYIINQTKYELNITGEEEKVEINIVNDSIYSLSKSY